MNRGTSKAYVIGLAVAIFAALAVAPRHPASAQVSSSTNVVVGDPINRPPVDVGDGGDPSLTKHPTNPQPTPVGHGQAQPAQANGQAAQPQDNQGGGGGGCCG